MRRLFSQFGSLVGRYWTWFIFGLFSLSLSLNVGQGIIDGEPPRTISLANAALISFGALSVLCFTYATVLPTRSHARKVFVKAGVQLFFSVVLTVVAVAAEQLARLYTGPNALRIFLVLRAPDIALFGLVGIAGLIYTFVLVAAYRGMRAIVPELYKAVK